MTATTPRAASDFLGRALRPIELQPWGERIFCCVDPLGNKLCFVQNETAFTGGLI